MKRRTREDDGAALMIVLAIVVAFALVTSVVLAQIDTSFRSALAVRDEASTSYGADAAAKVVVNQLVKDTLNGTAGSCNLNDVTVSLPNIYPASSGLAGSAASSAYVTCTHDSGNSNGSPTLANTSPGSALLTLDPNLSDVGIYSNVNAGAIKIRGGVFSNSAVYAPGGLVNVWSRPTGSTANTYNLARGSCTPATNNVDKGFWVADPAQGTTTCNYSAADSRGQDPGTLTPHGASYDAPANPSGNGTVSTCANSDKYQTVTPGRFSGSAARDALNGLTGCKNGVVWFKPGTYYFDLPDTWSVPSVYLVGGTVDPANADLTKDPSTWADPSRACVVPGASGATTGSGVQFVLGGSTRIDVNNSANPGAHVTLCASNTTSGPPIAVYGLKTALGGTFPVAASTLCTPSGTGSTACAAITTGNSPKSVLVIQGTTYVPRSVVSVTLNNNSQKIFYWGLISYATEFGGTGSAQVANAVVDVPDTAANPTPTTQVVYLSVYVCPGASSCSASGRLLLKAKVSFAPTTRKATVLSWSHQG